MEMKSIVVSVLVTLLGGGMFVFGKYVERQDFSPVLISVEGRGEVTAVPDIAEVSFGVQTDRLGTAEKAMAQLSDKMNAVVAAVKAAGIEEKDITTQNLSLYPSYDWKEGVRIDQGFEANQSLQVKVRDLSNIGAILAAATSAGANQAGGVSFTIDDPEMLQAQAREKAITDAEAKAQVLARQLKKRIVKMKGYSEGGGGVPPIVFAEKAMLRADGVDAAMPAPVPAGEQEVVVTVSLMYEVK